MKQITLILTDGKTIFDRITGVDRTEARHLKEQSSRVTDGRVKWIDAPVDDERTLKK